MTVIFSCTQRIGRMVFRAAYAHPDVEIVAVNDPFMVRPHVNLLKRIAEGLLYPTTFA